MYKDKQIFYPICIYPKQIQSIIKETSEKSNYPLNYIAASVLFAISSAIGNSRVLEVGLGRKIRPILFMALLGGSGSAKTPAINFALDPFLEIDKRNLTQYSQELRTWRQTPTDEQGEKPIAIQLRVQDVTIEALCRVLSRNEHGVFYHSDELHTWIGSFNRYRNGGDGDLSHWLSIWGNHCITVNRCKDDVLFVDEPFVNVIGGIQPSVLSRLFGGINMENGFFYRILFVSNSSEGIPMHWKNLSYQAEIPELWNSLINKILTTSGYGGQLKKSTYKLGEDAEETYINWLNSKELEYSEKADHIIAIFRKVQEYCLRFALIIHTVKETAGEVPATYIIDDDTMMKAIILAEYFMCESLNAYEIVTTEDVDFSRIYLLINNLDTEFTTEQAELISRRMQIPRATFFRILKVAVENKFIAKIGHGHYKKNS